MFYILLCQCYNRFMIRFYYGDNDFAITRQVSLIKDQFSKQYGAEDVVRLSSTADAEKVFTELTSVGLFSTKRLVILDSVFSDKTLTEKLPDVLKIVNDDTDLIIIDRKPDKRTKLYKMLISGEAEEFLVPKNLNQFAGDEALRQNVKISKEAISDLIVYTNGDAWRISNEIAKLKSLKQDITQQHIEKYVEPDLVVDVFSVLDSLFSGQKKEAINRVSLLEQSEDPNPFFALLASQIFVLSAIKSSTKPLSVVAKDMNVHPYVLSKMQNTARKVSMARVSEISKYISKTDMDIKRFNREDAWSLIKLVIGKI